MVLGAPPTTAGQCGSPGCSAYRHPDGVDSDVNKTDFTVGTSSATSTPRGANP